MINNIIAKYLPLLLKIYIKKLTLKLEFFYKTFFNNKNLFLVLNILNFLKNKK